MLQVFAHEHYSTTTLSSLSVFFSSVQFPLFICDCDAPSKSHYSFMCQTDRGTHMRPHIYFRLEIGGKIAARTKQRLCYTFSFAPRTLDRGRLRRRTEQRQRRRRRRRRCPRRPSVVPAVSAGEAAVEVATATAAFVCV